MSVTPMSRKIDNVENICRKYQVKKKLMKTAKNSVNILKKSV